MSLSGQGGEEVSQLGCKHWTSNLYKLSIKFRMHAWFLIRVDRLSDSRQVSKVTRKKCDQIAIILSSGPYSWL